MTQENHPTMEQIAKHHLEQSDAWRFTSKHPMEDDRRKVCQDKAEWHLRAADEILTHTPKAAV